MPRRDKNPPRLAVRVSHEATRRSKAQVAAAFECLVPVLERWVRPLPGADRDPMAGATRPADQRMRRR
jgi:hypothetical protein